MSESEKSHSNGLDDAYRYSGTSASDFDDDAEWKDKELPNDWGADLLEWRADLLARLLRNDCDLDSVSISFFDSNIYRALCSSQVVSTLELDVEFILHHQNENATRIPQSLRKFIATSGSLRTLLVQTHSTPYHRQHGNITAQILSAAAENTAITALSVDVYSENNDKTHVAVANVIRTNRSICDLTLRVDSDYAETEAIGSTFVDNTTLTRLNVFMNHYYNVLPIFENLHQLARLESLDLDYWGWVNEDDDDDDDGDDDGDMIDILEVSYDASALGLVKLLDTTKTLSSLCLRHICFDRDTSVGVWDAVGDNRSLRLLAIKCCTFGDTSTAAFEAAIGCRRRDLKLSIEYCTFDVSSGDLVADYVTSGPFESVAFSPRAADVTALLTKAT